MLGKQALTVKPDRKKVNSSSEMNYTAKKIQINLFSHTQTVEISSMQQLFQLFCMHIRRKQLQQESSFKHVLWYFPYPMKNDCSLSLN
jgi:hypothetical protein